jgi:hypothetical protein
MKKILALCALALTVGYVQAQIAPGRLMIGSNIGYQSQKNEQGVGGELRIKRLIINPQLGYFVAENFAVGLDVAYINQKDNYSSWQYGNGETELNTTILSPFARYYIFTSNEKFAFYAEAMVGIGFSKTDPSYSDEDINGKNFNARLSPGFSYFFTEKWVLDLQLSGISYVSNDPNKEDDADNDENYSFVFGASSFNPSLGFRYFIGK